MNDLSCQPSRDPLACELAGAFAEPLRVAHLEESIGDAQRIRNALIALSCSICRPETMEQLQEALARAQVDVVLCDDTFKETSGREVVRLVRNSAPHVPVIVVAENLGDETVAELLRLGARDYVGKGSLSRLAAAVQRVRAEEAGIRARKAVEAALRESELKYRRLFEAARDALVLVDAVTGSVLDANCAFEDLLGFTRREAIGRCLADIPALRPLLATRGPRLQAEPLRTAPERVRLQTSGDRQIEVEVVLSRYRLGQTECIKYNLRDVSDRLQAEQARAKSEVLFRALVENASDIFLITDATGLIRYASPAVSQVALYEVGEVVGTSLLCYVLPEERDAALQTWKRILENPGLVVRSERRFLARNGEARHVETVSQNLLDNGALAGIVVVLRDLTERRRADAALEESEVRFRALIEQASDIAAVIDPDGCIKYVNSAVRELGGYEPCELIGKNLLSLVHPDDARTAGATLGAILATPGGVQRSVSRFRHANGEWRWAETLSRNLLDTSPINGIVVNMRDITERRLAEEALRRSRATLAQAERIAHLGNWVLNAESGSCEWSDETYRIFGVDPAGFQPSYSAVVARVHPDDRARLDEAARHSLATHRSLTQEHRIVLDGGAVRYVQASAIVVPDASGAATRMVGTVLDITERRRIEDRLRHTNRALRTLSAGNTALVHGVDEMKLYEEMCRVAVEVGEYSGAWVGLWRPHEPVPIAIVARAAQAGAPCGATAAPEGIGFDESGPILQSLRECTVESFSAPGGCPLLALPLVQGSRAFGVLVIADGAESFGRDEVALLQELAADLAYGVVSLRERAAHEASQRHLRETMEATIYAIAGTIERRDIYTAGHQRRVATLACAIGRELGLDEERLRGLRLAAVIHDVGKITVPSEILNKPGRLSPLEFEMVKQHPDTGYEIVRDVHFPWPIAEMIRQHHECLDGSGYPRGLRGDAILLEARIIAIADAVDAIASHRPYRPARGLDAALAVLEAGRGSHYDPAAVDVCVRLFREKNYVMPT